ncbi:hypothetical protein B566_EDAN004490 [Ephemera danica]|nr:hypothetical protein B566_EDAN004490 [Ephemera danica]
MIAKRRNQLLKRQKILAILEQASDSEGDDVDLNSKDSDYEDHVSVASDENDNMTVPEETPTPLVRRRRFMDGGNVIERNVRRRTNEMYTTQIRQRQQILEENEIGVDPYEFEDEEINSTGRHDTAPPSITAAPAPPQLAARASTSGTNNQLARVQLRQRAPLPPSDDNDDEPATTNRNTNSRTYVSKDETVWDKRPPATGRARANDIRRDRGPRANIPPTTAITNPVDAFLFFIQAVLLLIVQYTNMGAQKIHDVNNYKTEWKDCDEIEIKAFIGLILLAGVMRQSKHSLAMLWSSDIGPPTFCATMSLHRFKQLLRYMRFDDKEHRPADDRFAPIRELWEIINSNFGRYYTPGDNITVDEQLLPYRGRCGFRQYMPSKPDKYGIKVWVATDSDTYYPLNTRPYLGREGNERAVGLGSQVFTTLTEPYYNTGRNVTCDNYFTSLALAKHLGEKGLTLLGTVKKNKKFLPEEFKPDRKREEGSSVFGFQHDSTIVSYVPKKGKSVALLSTMHHDDKIDEETGKPEIIMDYNATKGGVDTLDQMAHTYTCKRATRRWPMAFFYNLIDLAGIAAYVIWTSVYPNWNRKRLYRRRMFLKDVAKALLAPQIERRYESMRNTQTRATIAQVLVRTDDDNNGIYNLTYFSYMNKK